MISEYRPSAQKKLCFLPTNAQSSQSSSSSTRSSCRRSRSRRSSSSRSSGSRGNFPTCLRRTCKLSSIGYDDVTLMPRPKTQNPRNQIMPHHSGSGHRKGNCRAVLACLLGFSKPAAVETREFVVRGFMCNFDRETKAACYALNAHVRSTSKLPPSVKQNSPDYPSSSSPPNWLNSRRIFARCASFRTTPCQSLSLPVAIIPAQYQ